MQESSNSRMQASSSSEDKSTTAVLCISELEVSAINTRCVESGIALGDDYKANMEMHLVAINLM